MKYPYDIAVFQNTTDTLSIEAHFIQNKEESPMKVFDETFSRFTLNILSKQDVSYINVPFSELPAMLKKTDIAADEHFRPKKVTKTEGGSGIDKTGPAFTKRFFAGKLKGKSPVDVLVENEDGKTILKEQYIWLKENLAKYPANAELMSAIVDASKLNIEELKGTSLDDNAPSVIEILNIGCRPLTRKAREDGKCFVYEGNVTWDTGRKYPVTVTIRNYYAEVIKRDGGLLNVNLSSKDTATERIKKFSLSASDWLYALKTMERAEQAFYFCHFGEGNRLAEAAAEQARKEYAASRNR